MIAFLDFEASSLGKKSFPVEVAWVFQDGRSRSFLIKPIEAWTDWSEEAEKLHGLSRRILDAEGVPVAAVAAHMMGDLSGHQLYASAPSWDGKWLSALLRGAGLPRHSLRLGKSDEAFFKAARLALGTGVSDGRLASFIAEMIEETQPSDVPAHRALPDAQLELRRWKLASVVTASDVGIERRYCVGDQQT